MNTSIISLAISNHVEICSTVQWMLPYDDLAVAMVEPEAWMYYFGNRARKNCFGAVGKVGTKVACGQIKTR